MREDFSVLNKPSPEKLNKPFPIPKVHRPKLKQYLTKLPILRNRHRNTSCKVRCRTHRPFGRAT